MSLISKVGEDVRQNGWSAAIKRHWAVFAAPAAVLVIGLWLLLRDGSQATPGADRSRGGAADTAVALDSAAQRLAQIELLVAHPAAGAELIANGTIAFDENRASVVAPRSEGRIVNVRADLGQRVSAGTALVTLSSTEVAQARGDFERARATYGVAKRNYEREKRLFEQSISPEKEMLDAEVVYRTAEADVRSTGSRLESLGAGGGTGGLYDLRSPVSGWIVKRSAMPGQIVGPESDLFTVTDLRHVWIAVDLYDADVGRVANGSEAVVTTNALPGERFPGRLTYGGGIIDPTTRTMKVRVEVENQQLKLRPGMYAQVRFAPRAGVVDSSRVLIPEIAVQDLDGTPVVFVPTTNPQRFVVRKVSVSGAPLNGRVMIVAGLRAGERFVGRGAFQVKAQLTKSSFGEED